MQQDSASTTHTRTWTRMVGSGNDSDFTFHPGLYKTGIGYTIGGETTSTSNNVLPFPVSHTYISTCIQYYI